MNDSRSRLPAAANPWDVHRGPRRSYLWTYVMLGSLLVLLVWSYRGSEVHLGLLFSQEGVGQILIYIRRLFPPDLSRGVLADAAMGAMETFAISFLGILMATVIALLLVFFASRNLVFSGLLYEMEETSRWRRSIRI